jgi:Flp pilus assembly protein TadG
MRKFDMITWNDQRGATAVEFAIVGPVFITLVIGILYMCMGLLVVGSLHYAVEEGARCASVRTTVCSDATTTVSYAQSRYFGPSSAPTFTYAVAACGNSVSGSINYVVDLGLEQITVPISATACFP